MTIRQSLLALLSEGPRHGYQLKAEFEARTGSTWPLNIGQVYSTLDRLERDGMVRRGDEDGDGRVAYAITQKGRDDVSDWFASPVVQPTAARDELSMKLAMAVTIDGVDVTSLIQAQRRSAMLLLQDLSRARRDADDLAWRLVLESRIFHTEAEVRWLDHCESAVLRSARRGTRKVAPAPSSDGARARSRS